MVSTARPHQRTAWQRFLGDGTLAFLPLADGLELHRLVAADRARRKTAAACRRRTSSASSRRISTAALGAVRLASERLKFPLWRLVGRQLCGRARRPGRRRRARGASAGRAGRQPGIVRRRGAGRRAGRRASARGEDLGAERILRRYERWRRSENELMSAAIDAFDRLLARGSGRVAELAQRGMPWVGRRPSSSAPSSNAPWGSRASCPPRRADVRPMLACRQRKTRRHGGHADRRGRVLVHGRGPQAADRALLRPRRWPRCAACRRCRWCSPGRCTPAARGNWSQVRWPLHLVRGVLAVFMMITFTYALKSLSLAKTYSIFFVAPLLIALLSIVLLGERVSRAQWSAIAVGFVGVLIVLKPETTRLRLVGHAGGARHGRVLRRLLGDREDPRAAPTARSR